MEMRANSDLEILVDEPDIRISVKVGDKKQCVVSFSGIGKSRSGEGEVQREEFRRSLEDMGDITIVFVMDKTRSWLNETADRVINFLEPYLSNFSQVTTLGHSMGGYAALYLASALPNCNRAVAFAPQFSVNPRFVPECETRWGKFISRIATHTIDHVFDRPGDGIDYWIIMGTNEPLEREHLKKIQTYGVFSERLHIIRIEEAGHEVSQYLRVIGALSEILGRLVHIDGPAVADIERIIDTRRVVSTDTQPGRPSRKLDKWKTRRSEKKEKRMADKLALKAIRGTSRHEPDRSADLIMLASDLPAPRLHPEGAVEDSTSETASDAAFFLSAPPLQIEEAMTSLSRLTGHPFRLLLRELLLTLWELRTTSDQSGRYRRMQKVAAIRGQLLDLADSVEDAAGLWAERHRVAAVAWAQAFRRLYDYAMILGVDLPLSSDTLPFDLDAEVLKPGWFPTSALRPDR